MTTTTTTTTTTKTKNFNIRDRDILKIFKYVYVIFIWFKYNERTKKNKRELFKQIKCFCLIENKIKNYATVFVVANCSVFT